MSHKSILIRSSIPHPQPLKHTLLIKQPMVRLKIKLLQLLYISHVLRRPPVLTHFLVMVNLPSALLFPTTELRRVGTLRRRLQQRSLPPPLPSPHAAAHVVAVPEDFEVHDWWWLFGALFLLAAADFLFRVRVVLPCFLRPISWYDLRCRSLSAIHVLIRIPNVLRFPRRTALARLTIERRAIAR